MKLSRTLSAMLCWIACGMVDGSGALAHTPKREVRLPVVGEAPPFTLAAHDGTAMSLRDLRGQVVVLSFIFTRCKDACPALTAKLVDIQKRLGAREGNQAAFVAVTVDPERDTPQVLAQYARNLGATHKSWRFLTGDENAIRAVTDGFAVFARRAASGEIEHSFLTSLIDRRGQIRVQYMGVRFAATEFLQDLRSLLREPASP